MELTEKEMEFEAMVEEELEKRGIHWYNARVKWKAFEREIENYRLELNSLKKYYDSIGRREIIEKIERYDKLCNLRTDFLLTAKVGHFARRRKDGESFVLFLNYNENQLCSKDETWEKKMVGEFQELGYGELVEMYRIRNVFEPTETYSWIAKIETEISAERYILKNELEVFILALIKETEQEVKAREFLGA